MNITIDTSKIKTDEDAVKVLKLMLKKQWSTINIHDVSWDDQHRVRHLRKDK